MRLERRRRGRVKKMKRASMVALGGEDEVMEVDGTKKMVEAEAEAEEEEEEEGRQSVDS